MIVRWRMAEAGFSLTMVCLRLRHGRTIQEGMIMARMKALQATRPRADRDLSNETFPNRELVSEGEGPGLWCLSQ